MRFSELHANASDLPLKAAVHVATAYGHDGNLAQVVESNLLLPLRLLDHCRTVGCAHFLNTDTFFGKSQFEYPYMKAYIKSKRDLIAWAKLACDAQADLCFSSLRLEHVYGEGDSPRKFVPDLVARLQNRQPEIPLTFGNQERDFIHVSDVARAFACVLDLGPNAPKGVTEYEVGTGRAIPLRQLVETACEVTGSSSRLCFGALPHRQGEIMYSVADTRRLAALGWRSTVSLREGLQRTATRRDSQ